MIKESFKAKIEKNWCFMVPRKVRWLHKLKAGAILKFEVQLFDSYPRRESFYGTLYKDGRVYVPTIIRELLKLKPHQILSVKIEVPKDSLEKTIFRSMKKVQVSTGRGLFSSRD